MDASHELRTPLTSMRTNVDLLRRARTIGDDERLEILDDVSRELDELGSLVGELVELSTASRRPDEPIVPVDLALVAADVADRARRRHDRPVDVRTDAPATIAGRRSLLDRALWNLVDNAAKFSAEPTAIEIRVDGGVVEVRDHGPGIAASDREHVFSRFYRAVETRSAPGSGLGHLATFLAANRAAVRLLPCGGDTHSNAWPTEAGLWLQRTRPARRRRPTRNREEDSERYSNGDHS